MDYTFAEMTDMLLVYGMAHCNGREAERLYSERFPDRRHPCRATFASIERRLREHGALSVHRPDAGVNRTLRTIQLEEAILELVENEPSTSTRTIARALDINHVTVWQVLREQLLYPYHLQRVQNLSPADFPLRVHFCQWYLQKIHNLVP